MTLQGDPLVATLIPWVTYLRGYHFNHQGKIRKKISFPSKCFIIKKGLFSTCSNYSNIKVTLTIRLDLLHYKERPTSFSRLSWCDKHYYAISGEWWRVVERRGSICSM